MFKLASHLNNFLPSGEKRVDVVFNIESLVAEAQVNVTSSAEKIAIFVVDNSGSMSQNNKLVIAKNALVASIDNLPADVSFGLLSFNDKSTVHSEICLATNENKEKAKRSINYMNADGGTAIGNALLSAKKILLDRYGNSLKSKIVQVILLTDGKNEGEKVEFLDKALSACEGFFQVQAVGFGQDWDQKELMKIANKMTGKATSVTNTSDLGNLMKDALASAMSKNIADVRLRFWTPKIVSFKVFKQSYPTEIDLTSSMISVDPRTIEFPLGAFGAEAQDYFATFEVPANQNGDQCLVCRPSLVYTDPNKGELVKIDGKEVAVQWTDDTSYSMRMNRQVAHYSGQAEKAQAIQEGLDAYRSGDTEKATVQLQKAVKLARESGDDATVANIRKIAEIDDKDFSVVIKRNTTKANLMDLEVGSSRSVRIQKKD